MFISNTKTNVVQICTKLRITRPFLFNHIKKFDEIDKIQAVVAISIS